MARSFHEAYGYKSVAVGKGILPACTHSHIVEVLKVEPRLEEDDVFVRTLTEFAKNFSGQRLLLVPCGDNYIKMLCATRRSCAAFMNSSASAKSF